MDFSPIILSLKISALATLFACMLGIMAANKVRKLKRFRGLIDGIFTLPMVLPPTVLGFFLLIIFGRNGFIGRLLKSINSEIIFTWKAGVMAATVVAFPLAYRTVLSSFDDIDENMIFAAQTLGIGNLKIFWSILIPNSISGIMGGAILAFARALGEFGTTMMVAGNIKGRTQTVAIAIYTAVQNGDRMTAYIWAIMIMAISFIMLILMNYFNKYNRKRKSRG